MTPAAKKDQAMPTPTDARSGYVLCPCCGYDTVASDDRIPELCLECEDAGCSESEPSCEGQWP